MKEVPTDSVTLNIGEEKLELTVSDPFWLGNTMAFSYKDHNPRFVIGPHWPLFLCSSLIIVGFASVFLFFILLNRSILLTLIGALILLIDIGSFTLTAIMNPGIPDRNLQKYTPEYIELLRKNKSLGYCSKCRVIRDTSLITQHCTDCDVCVEGYDHHCPWTGKCIGKSNALYFYTFLASTFILLFYLMGAALTSLP